MREFVKKMTIVFLQKKIFVERFFFSCPKLHGIASWLISKRERERER